MAFVLIIGFLLFVGAWALSLVIAIVTMIAIALVDAAIGAVACLWRICRGRK